MIIAQLGKQGVLGSLTLIGNSESSILGSKDYKLWRQKMQRLIGSSQIAGSEKKDALLTLPGKNFVFLEAFDVFSRLNWSSLALGEHFWQPMARKMLS